MQTNNDKFKEIAGKALRQFEVKPPDNLWKKIEAANKGRRQRVLIFRISSIAASILLLASIGFFYLNNDLNFSHNNNFIADKVSPKNNDNKKPSAKKLANDSVEVKNNATNVNSKQVIIRGQDKESNSKETQSNSKETQLKSTNTIKKVIPGPKRLTPVNRNTSGNSGTHNYIAEEHFAKPVYTDITPHLTEVEEYELSIASIPTDSVIITSKPQLLDIQDLLPNNDDLAFNDNKNDKSEPWSLALGYNLTSGEEFNNNGDQLSPNRSSYSYDQFSAYLANETSYFEEIENTEHDAPLSVGITIDLPASRRLSFETGLMYTKLGFRVKTDEFGSYYSEYRNQIHYLGIPAGIRYSFIERQRFDMYAMQWVVLEKGIAGRWYINEYGNNTLLTTEANHHSINGVQVSSISGLGVQYRLTKHLHLFGQGGVQVFFLNKTQPYNIRSSHIAWPSIQTGLRLGL